MSTRCPRIGLSYAVDYGSTFEEFIEFAASANAEEVQLIPDQTPNLLSELGSSRAESIKKELQKKEISASVHGVFYDINICSVVPEVRENSLRITEGAAQFARAIGSKYLVVHPGYMFPGWRRDPKQTSVFWRAARKGIKELGIISQRHGIHILLENGSYHVCSKTGSKRTPLHLGISVDELQRLLCLSATELFVCFDVSKAVVSEESPIEFVKRLGPRIRQVQVSQAGVTDPALNSLVRSALKGSISDLSIIFEGRKSVISECLGSIRSLVHSEARAT